MSARHAVITGDSLEVLRTLRAESAHAMVTDPPAGITLHGLEWDSDRGGSEAWIEWLTSVMREAIRVLRPGAHALVWAYPRTSHWTARALELAGFEVRNVLTHAFAYRMPKGIELAPAIDRHAGSNGRVIGTKVAADFSKGHGARTRQRRTIEVREPTTRRARRWLGYQTSIRGATEHWILVRKPLRCGVVETVLEHGTCGLNVGACSAPGRQASTFVVSHEERCDGGTCAPACPTRELGDAAKYFYAHRPSSSEIEAGCERLPRRAMDGSLDPSGRGNFHASPKPISLMRWLVRLVGSRDALILDPFAGSGTTGIAAALEGMRFVGIEQSVAAARVARARIAHWSKR